MSDEARMIDDIERLRGEVVEIRQEMRAVADSVNRLVNYRQEVAGRLRAQTPTLS
jgi:hypothetical protein